MPEPEENVETTPEAPPEETPAPELTAEEAFRFDPFSAPVDAEGQPEIEETPAEETPPAAPVAAAPAAAPVAPPAASPPTRAPDPREQTNLVELNRQLLAELATLRAANAPKPPEAPAAPDVPQYNIGFPPELKEALRSQDPEVFMQGLQALSIGIAQITHQNLREEYRKFYDEREQKIVHRIQTETAARESAQRIFTDFYGSYPQLNKPELHQVVSQAAKAVTEELGGNPPWTPELKKKVAERVFGLFGTAPPAQASETPAATPAPAGGVRRAPAPPPRQRGVGVRPAAPAAPKPGSQEQHISDVLGASY